MAYVSQELKRSLAPQIKTICQKYGVKGTLSVRHHSTLVLTINRGVIDFIGTMNRVCGDARRSGSVDFTAVTDHISVNTHWFKEHFDGVALEFLSEVIAVMNSGNHDNSDIQCDYFDVGWYVDVNIGRWDQPYHLEA